MLPSFGTLHGAFLDHEAGPQGGSFLINSSSRISGPCVTSEMHYIFRNTDLPVISGGKPKTTTVACNVLRVSWATMTNNSKQDFSCLVLRFLLGNSICIVLMFGIYPSWLGFLRAACNSNYLLTNVPLILFILSYDSFLHCLCPFCVVTNSNNNT